MRKVTTKTVTTRYETTYSAADLKLALGLPNHAKLVVTVPSGGDYSGVDLDLADDRIDLQVTWEEVEKS